MPKFYTLEELQDTISGIDADLTLVYANGKRSKPKKSRDLTTQELKTTVLNIFATARSAYDIHLTKLYKKGGEH